MFMAAFLASDPSEAVMKNPTVEVAVNNRPEVGTVKPIGPLKTFLIDPFKGIEMILDTLVIKGILRPARAVEDLFWSPFFQIDG